MVKRFFLNRLSFYLLHTLELFFGFYFSDGLDGKLVFYLMIYFCIYLLLPGEEGINTTTLGGVTRKRRVKEPCFREITFEESFEFSISFPFEKSTAS